MHGKSVRQRNYVRQDNTMDRAGTLPLNLYETETVLRRTSQFEFTDRHRKSSK